MDANTERKILQASAVEPKRPDPEIGSLSSEEADTLDLFAGEVNWTLEVILSAAKRQDPMMATIGLAIAMAVAFKAGREYERQNYGTD